VLLMLLLTAAMASVVIASHQSIVTDCPPDRYLACLISALQCPARRRRAAMASAGARSGVMVPETVRRRFGGKIDPAGDRRDTLRTTGTANCPAPPSPPPSRHAAGGRGIVGR